jgi:hypothetical protein
MGPSLATVEDMEARLGRAMTDATERARAQALLDDASALVRFETNQSYIDPDTGDLVADLPDIVVTITVNAALRGWYNPAGIESAQLGAVSVRYGSAWLTNTEREQLALMTRGKGLSQAILIGSFGFDGAPYGYVPVDNAEGLSTPAADWFPLGY